MQETFYSFPVPLSIALVADLHDHPYTDIISSLQINKPDIICIAGDFTHGGFPASGLKMENTKYALSFLAACTVIAPVYVSLGNPSLSVNGVAEQCVLTFAFAKNDEGSAFDEITKLSEGDIRYFPDCYFIRRA